MELSTFYIALVFLVPAVLAFTLLGAMTIDLAGAVVAKPKTPSIVKRKVVTNRVKDDIGCYAAI
jgi:hypothetical protein